ncbi:MAG TPA: hypothetical protein VGE01_01165 [Fimbriimonas sp.]
MNATVVAALALAPVPFFKGMSLTSWSADALASPECATSIARMSQIYVDTVAVNVWEFQDEETSTAIAPDYTRYSSTTLSLRTAIRRIKAKGMKVMLKPNVDLRNGAWRGTIVPSEAWFASYRKFINKYAQLAAQEKVEVLSVGCEFNKAQTWEGHWRDVAKGVRAVYPGLLTYSSNHDSYSAVKWWDAMDFVGIDAYFVLTSKTNPSPAELTASVNRVADGIAAWRSASGILKPVAFNEAGYRSEDGANMHPWDWSSNGALDLREQKDCYQALYETMRKRSWWRGVFWWNWETDPQAGGLESNGFTPQNKPAEWLLKVLYFF